MMADVVCSPCDSDMVSTSSMKLLTHLIIRELVCQMDSAASTVRDFSIDVVTSS